MTRLFVPVLFMLICWACTGAERSASNVLHLTELFDEADVQGSVAPNDGDGALLEWRFDGETTPNFASDAIDALQIRDARLQGRSVDAFPVVVLDGRVAEAINPDLVYAFEVKARISAGSNLAVEIGRSGEGELRDIPSVLREFPWLATTPILPGEDMQTYVLRPNPGYPRRSSEIRRIFVRPTDEPGAEFELESVRVVLRREHLATIPSGVSWQGLGGIYQETLVARSPEVIHFELELPRDEPYLDLAVGTVQETPVTFRIASNPTGASGEEDALVVEHTITTPNRWEDASIDLTRYAGRSVTLSMTVDAMDDSVLGFWGAPVVRTRNENMSQGVIVIWADTLRRDHLDAYGYDRPTAPALKRMADEGTLFRNTVAQATWTKLNTPSFFTSRYPSSHGVREWRDRIPASVETLAEVYRRAGYATFSFASNSFTGQGTNLHQGFEIVHESSSLAEADRHKSARAGIDRLIDWLELKQDVPFFAFMSFLDPHDPFKPRAPFDTMWADPEREELHERQTESVRPTIENALLRYLGLPSHDELTAAGIEPDAYVAHLRDWYDGSIRGLDAEMGRLFEAIRRLGRDRRTLVLFTSDHGEEFLEHGRMFHGHTVYGEQNLVPLILWQPGSIPSGKIIEEPVQTIDLMPTLLELAGLPEPEGMQGQSLAPLLALATADAAPGDESEYRRRLSELGWQRRGVITEQPLSVDEGHTGASVAILEGGFKLVHHTIRSDPSVPEYQLFDFRADPLDQTDVAADHPDVVERLAVALDAWRAKAEAEKLESDAASVDKLDAEELKRLRALGYIQ